MAKITKKGLHNTASISLVTMESPLPIRKVQTIKLAKNKKEVINIIDFKADDSLDLSELLSTLIEIKNGNFNVKMPVNKIGLSGKIADTINEISSNNKKLIQEFNKAQLLIAKEGKLNERISFPDAQGEWKAGLDSLNLMISDLVYPIREMERVISDVAKGNLANIVPFGINDYKLQGEFARIAQKVNFMLKQLNLFTSEVTRVAREIGLEGKLGGRANVPGIEGSWKDLTDAMNLMTNDLATQIHNIARVAIAVANGDLSKKITENVRGDIFQLKENLNTMVDQLRGFASELTRVAHEVGIDGKLGEQSFVPGALGTWKNLSDSLNQMTGNLAIQVRSIAEVIKAVAFGDLSKTIKVEVKGEMSDLKNTINRMVMECRAVSTELIRVSGEVGTDGKLGGQAYIAGVAGVWKDLVDGVNGMASNFTSHVRGIAKIVTSVATGNLRQKLSIDAKGEVAELKDTFNDMIETLAIIANQVTNVAHEVGVEGKLGGQAIVPSASGSWKKLTENVNQLAENLTTQVRSISEVASAVTKGDLTRYISLDAKGEVEGLKDTVNQMISNLRATTLVNQDQDWLKTNLAQFNKMLQGQKDLKTVARHILSELAQVVSAHYGAFYILTTEDVFPKLKLFACYAYKSEKHIPKEFLIGEGLIGQCALEKKRINMTNIPDTYVKVTSGLGKAKPSNLVMLPVLFENNVKAVIELGTLNTFSNTHLDFLSQLTESIGIVVNTIQTNTRTEVLLSQSQLLTSALKEQQDELRRTNEELNDKAYMLLKQKGEVEIKNKEVEEARKSIEEKAEQLTLTSKYKSEFLANMSHELRTPLNSLLILAQQLFENPDGNLNDKQTRYAKTIYSCGEDLLELINDILDLSKIESGFVTPNISTILVSEISSFIETTFKPLAETKNLKFKIEIDPDLSESLDTDSQRLNQILKNLLSNAFKFTEKGEVKLKIFRTNYKWKADHSALNLASEVIAFSIKDSGIGIHPDKQTLIFEAFQQAEGSTSRKYGGTGLGLSISRGLADLLGGTIELESEIGLGSIFTLYLPVNKIESSMSNEVFELPQTRQKELDDILNSLKMSEQENLTQKSVDIKFKVNETSDDRNNILPNDKAVLVIEDDLLFGKIIIERAHIDGLKVVISSDYLEIFNFVTHYTPIAIILDIYLPDTCGWKILEMLKNDLNYWHIPIHVISREENKILALKRRAKSFSLKPLGNEQFAELFTDIIKFNSKEIKQLLVIENTEIGSSHIVKLFQESFIEITFVSTTDKAIQALQEKIFDSIILDYSLPDISENGCLENIIPGADINAPIIIYSSKDINDGDLIKLNKISNNIIFKDSNSSNRLFEETLMLMHVDYRKFPTSKRKEMENFRMKRDILAGKKVLVVDDDIRNLFAITSVFERYNIDVITAESSVEAISFMHTFSNIEMILMDIMMPEMDGYETIRKIRREHKNSSLPIIAVTAKAMKGDRQKCIMAGASDYITKPLQMDQLLSMMRMWFNK